MLENLQAYLIDSQRTEQYFNFFQVSIDAKLRAHIEDNLDSGDPDLFLNAKNYIYNLMSLDCFPRFIKSKYYKGLCK